MLVIANNHIKTEGTKSLDDIDRVELFYMVYTQLDYLAPKELKTLRDFCYALNDPYDLRITRPGKPEKEDDIYRKYKDILDNVVEQATIRKLFSKM